MKPVCCLLKIPYLKFYSAFLAVFMYFVFISVYVAKAETNDISLLKGDTRLACEAILCLSSPTMPAECIPSITRYYSISAKKISDTIKKRKIFLSLCPNTSDTDINDIANTYSKNIDTQ